jgi:hypothetical protein
MWQARVTDCVLILIVEQTKAGLQKTSRALFSRCVAENFAPRFSQTLDTNFTNLHQLAKRS